MSVTATAAINHLPLWALLSLSALFGAVIVAAGALAFVNWNMRRGNGLGGGDSVTGAASRREFVAQLDAAWQEGRDNGRQFGLLVIDIDRFAAINQLYGRETGNAVLAEVAERIRLRVRSEDILGRIDADEFALICLDASPEQLDAVRTNLEAFVSYSETVPAHVSIGVAVPERHDESGVAMLARARSSMRHRRDHRPAKAIDEALHDLITAR